MGWQNSLANRDIASKPSESEALSSQARIKVVLSKGAQRKVPTNILSIQRRQRSSELLMIAISEVVRIRIVVVSELLLVKLATVRQRGELGSCWATRQTKELRRFMWRSTSKIRQTRRHRPRGYTKLLSRVRRRTSSERLSLQRVSHPTRLGLLSKHRVGNPEIGIRALLQLLLLLRQSLQMEKGVINGFREIVAASGRRGSPQTRDHAIGHKAAIVETAIVQWF